MMPSQFDPAEFDQWAEDYDAEAHADTGFPFDGYTRVLKTIAIRALASRAAARADALFPDFDVLDLGAGTGNLSALLLEQGARLWCLDFSSKMLEIALRRLPQARFALADLRDEWPPEFQRRYHAVVSGYTFHHFPLDEKVALVRRLLERCLLPGGRVVIGDISFPDAPARDALRQQAGPAWDEEYYWLADETLPALAASGWQADYEQVSSCAGVYIIEG